MNRIGFVAISLMLTACGGGGGGGGADKGTTPTVPNTLTLQMNDVRGEIGDNATLKYVFQTNAKSPIFDLKAVNPLAEGLPVPKDLSAFEPSMTWKVEEGALVISTGDNVFGTKDLELTFKVSDSSLGGAKESKLILKLKNDSAESKLKQAEFFLNESQKALAFEELAAVEKTYQKVLSIKGFDYTVYKANYDLSPLTDEISNLSSIHKSLTELGDNQYDESDLSESVNNIDLLMTNYSNQYKGYLDTLVSIDNSLPSLPSTAFQYQDGQPSVFIGNENYGAYGVAGWNFKDEFQFIGNLIDPNFCTL